MNIHPTTLYIIVAILVVILIVSSYIIRNLLFKLEKFEDVVENQAQYITAVGDLIKDSNEKLKEVDSKGTFKSDDEVGYFFETLKQIQSNLDQFNVPENYAKKEEQS
jgi:hypothetical protein